jgi:hypothetical protein
VAMATLGVTEDDIRAAGIFQHFGADIAGEGTLFRRSAILTTECDTATRERDANLGDNCRRRANQEITAGLSGLRPGRQSLSQRQSIGSQPVHLPITGNELSSQRHIIP